MSNDDALTDEQRARLRAGIAAFRERMAARPRPKMVPTPPPVHDEVFYEGVAALNADAGEVYAVVGVDVADVIVRRLAYAESELERMRPVFEAACTWLDDERAEACRPLTSCDFCGGGCSDPECEQCHGDKPNLHGALCSAIDRARAAEPGPSDEQVAALIKDALDPSKPRTRLARGEIALEPETE